MTRFVSGIDFGTTNSAAALASDNINPQLIELEPGKTAIPTAVFFPKLQPACFGNDAVNNYTSGDPDGRFMRSMKRFLGSKTFSGTTVINGRSVPFSQIISFYIRHLRSKLNDAAGADVDSVVMGRPVHFRDNDLAGDNQAQSDLEAAACDAGFKNIAFQYEPIAAAFAHERYLSAEKLACVIDIGGGTSDFSVLRLSPERIMAADRNDDILANTGVRIGGNDFDRAIALGAFMPCFGMGTEYRSGAKLISVPPAPYISLATWARVNDVYNTRTLNLMQLVGAWACAPEKLRRVVEIIQNNLGHINLGRVEESKIQLSNKTQFKTLLEYISDNPVIELSRPEMEKLIVPAMETVKKSIEQCIATAQINNTDIDLIILTGGSTEIPYVRNVLCSYFPNADISAADKLCSVGLGLAYDAKRRFLS